MKQTLTLVLLVLSSICYSQRPTNQSPTKVTVKGDVTELDSNLPLEYATISFFNKEKTLVAGGITDQKGSYAIELPKGVYSVQFDFISYKSETLIQQRILKNTTLPTVKMELDASSLDEVVVRAETTEVQIRLDKKIYTIGKDLTTSGATISDALNNVPSVTVDVDGAIALRGNENVRILINGKPSAIAGFGSTDALQQLPADTIDRVEVITSPSARYDAEGTAGILNIILKKEKTLGLNGSVNANLGVPTLSTLTTNFNIRTDKFNIFNTTGINYRRPPGNALFKNTYLSETVENPIVIEDRTYKRLSKGFNTNLGIEYFINDKSSITASGFYRISDDKDITTNTTTEFDRLNALNISRDRTETEEEEDTNFQLSLNYENRFNTEGHKLTIDFQYEDGKETENAFIDESNTFPSIELLPAEIVSSLENKNEYLAQADYVLPLGDNAQFEAGFRADYEKSETDYELLEQTSVTSNFFRNDSISNIFTYQENILAAYTQYGNKFGKFSFLLGLRLENTELIGDVVAEDVETSSTDELTINFDNNFLGLFPTVNLIYELGEKENITLGYNRRINRPRGFFINPFPARSSEANIFQGNPNLSPAYANAFDLGYLKRWKKLTLTSSIYYQHETDAFERIQEDTGLLTSNGVPIIRTIPINLSSNDRYGFEAGILYNPFRWLRLNGSINYFKFKSKGTFNDVEYGTENDSWFSRGSVKVTLPSKIDWQTTIFYRGPRVNAQTSNKGIFVGNLAFSKDIINDNATIGFNVRDLFNTRKRRSTTTTDTFLSDSEFQWRERQFTLSFMYRFNQKKQRQRSNRGGGDDGGDFEG